MHPLDLFKYCPKCGSSRFDIHNAKSKKCADCGFLYYFNPSAATVAFILNRKGELLVCRRGKEPAKGTLDLSGGFIDMFETGEEGVARRVKEETGLTVTDTKADDSLIEANDDVADSFWVSLDKVNPEDFGLDSVRKGVARFLEEFRK